MNVEDFRALLKLLPMKDVYQYYFAIDEALCRLKGDEEIEIRIEPDRTVTLKLKGFEQKQMVIEAGNSATFQGARTWEIS